MQSNGGLMRFTPFAMVRLPRASQLISSVCVLLCLALCGSRRGILWLKAKPNHQRKRCGRARMYIFVTKASSPRPFSGEQICEAAIAWTDLH